MSILGAGVVLALGIILTLLIGLASIKHLRKWALANHRSSLKPLGIVGLLGGLVALVLILLVGDTFGFPGSRDYQTYELFNRSMSFILALQSCAILAFATAHYGKLTNFGQNVLAVILGGWIAMAIGTAAEFWLFSSLPYAEINMRSFSFSLFSMGSLITGLSMLILGFKILRSRRITWLFGILFIAYLPLDIALFILNESIFLASAVGAISIALTTLIDNRNSDLTDMGGAKIR